MSFALVCYPFLALCLFPCFNCLCNFLFCFVGNFLDPRVYFFESLHLLQEEIETMKQNENI